MKKKLLLVGVAAMGLLAVGVGATSTFAWFTASQNASVTALSGNTNSSISVTDVASSEDLGIQVGLTWTGVDTAVQLTSTGASSQVAGTTYVIDQNNTPVKATNQGTLIKYGTGVVTANTVAADAGSSAVIKKWDGSDWVNTTAADRYLLNSKTFDIYVAGDNQLRIAVALTACTDGGSTANPSYVAGARVKLATVTITATAAGAVSYSYANVTGDFSAVTDSANFYYSVSPKSTTATTGESTTAGAYGTLTAYLAAA